MIASLATVWRGKVTHKDFTLDDATPPKWASSTALRDWAANQMRTHASVTNPGAGALDLLKQIKASGSTTLTVMQTASTSWEELTFEEEHRKAVAFVVSNLGNGLLSTISHVKALPREGGKLWECHVLKVIHCALTTHVESIHSLNATWFNTIARDELYASWATSLLIERVDGTITFKDLFFTRSQGCTIVHVDGFLGALGLSENQELRDHFANNEMLKFVKLVVKLVLER